MFSKFVFLGQTELLFSITDRIAQQFSRYELVNIEIVYYTLRSEVVARTNCLEGELVIFTVLPSISLAPTELVYRTSQI